MYTGQGSPEGDFLPPCKSSDCSGSIHTGSSSQAGIQEEKHPASSMDSFHFWRGSQERRFLQRDSATTSQAMSDSIRFISPSEKDEGQNRAGNAQEKQSRKNLTYETQRPPHFLEHSCSDALSCFLKCKFPLGQFVPKLGG